MSPSTLLCTVVARTDLADNVVGLTLAAQHGEPLAGWTAGAHVDLLLPEQQVRQYSLCGDPEDRLHYQVAVLREPAGRGGSRWIHDHLQVGDTLPVGTPRNHFALVPAPRYLFVAGGIGITPILPMIAAAERAGAQWQLHYGGRSRASMAFTETLARHGDRVRLWPQDHTGLIDLPAILRSPDADTAIYCCGPEPLLQAIKDTCNRQGWPVGALHVEHFAAQQPTGAAQDQAFEIELQRSGQTLTVPADRSILQVLMDAGIHVDQSCSAGVCGTCETRVLAGEPDHRDSVLSDSDRQTCNTMMVCVSRARSARLVLDL